MYFITDLMVLIDSMGYLAIGLACVSMVGSAVGESLICCKALDSMARNPEIYSKLRTAMIIGCGITESIAIYALLIAILVLFVG